MKAVLDSCVGISAVLNEPHSAQCKAFLSDYRKGLHELLSPDIFIAEVAHVLTKAERNKIIQPGNAIILLNQVLTGGPQLVSFVPFTARALEISAQARIGFYDCLSCALAEQEEIELVTVDQRLINALKVPCIRHIDSL